MISYEERNLRTDLFGDFDHIVYNFVNKFLKNYLFFEKFY